MVGIYVVTGSEFCVRSRGEEQQDEQQEEGMKIKDVRR
jgi:hypothetical protein